MWSIFTKLLGGSNDHGTAAEDLNRTAPRPDKRLVREEDTSATLTLPDGRKLGYAQFGLSTGKPILYCHGLPGSRLEAGHLHEAAIEVGARIIAVDRPGMGLSTPQPGRTLLDHPRDLEQLAAHLGLGEYGVMGVSGGGPSALACAMAMPRDKLKCVAVVCGLGPPDIGMSGAGWFHWVGFTIGWAYAPRAAAWFLHRQGRFHLPDEKRVELMLEEAARNKAKIPKVEDGIWTDREIVGRMVMSSRSVYAQGIDGAARDGYLGDTDFGFRLEDIRKDLPVRLWYGKHDTSVPPVHGRQIAARIGDSALLRMEEDTHASIFFRWRREILLDMVRNM